MSVAYGGISVTPSTSDSASVDDLKAMTSVRRIRTLYLQLLYRCNFSCRHCFHGERLAWRDGYSPAEAVEMLDYFAAEYELERVCLLGGEPLIYAGLVDVARAGSSRGLLVHICTNGHGGFLGRLPELVPYLHRLRVSVDGLEVSHDALRQRGSFAAAMLTLDTARDLGMRTGVTTTVTRYNAGEIPALARLVEDRGAGELTLHCLREVGNAAANHDLVIDEPGRYAELREALQCMGLRMAIRYDSDLAPEPTGAACSNLIENDWLDRIEADPRGTLTVSCKAVGRDVHAFRWDRQARVVRYEPGERDELRLPIADVTYLS
jgi:MoaA/NifB/PqqE/SkfB family radical SAM enzyme